MGKPGWFLLGESLAKRGSSLCKESLSRKKLIIRGANCHHGLVGHVRRRLLKLDAPGQEGLGKHSSGLYVYTREGLGRKEDRLGKKTSPYHLGPGLAQVPF